MRREELFARLRGTAAEATAAVRRLAGPAGRERARRAWAEVRRRPDAVAAAAFLAGVLVMILHWR